MSVSYNPPTYRSMAKSKVAVNPTPKGVVQLYGGAFFQVAPTIFYEALLTGIYNAGYTVIAVPFKFGFNHGEIARNYLLPQRDQIRMQLALENPIYKDLPHFWVGHSLGCKMIALLEAYTDLMGNAQTPPSILNEPSILIAPSIEDTKDSIRLPLLGDLLAGALDLAHLGVNPNSVDTKQLIKQSGLFGLTDVIAFTDDDVSGNFCNSPETGDAAWFLSEIGNHKGKGPQGKQIEGNHYTPVSFRLGESRSGAPRFIGLNRDLTPVCSGGIPELSSTLMDLLKQLAVKAGPTPKIRNWQ